MTSSIAIVSGIPRSGTSMMMQMLGAGGVSLLFDDFFQPDASNAKGYFEYQFAGRVDLVAKWIGKAEGMAMKVFHDSVSSLPPNHLYDVIVMRRDPAAIVKSQIAFVNQRSAGVAVSEAKLKSVVRFQERVIGQLIEQLSKCGHFRFCQVWYEEVLRQPLIQSKRIARFLSFHSPDPLAMAGKVEA